MEWNCLHLIACHSKIIANNDHQPASHWQAFSAVHHSLALAHVAITLKTMLNHSQQHRAVWAQISKWNVNCARSVAHCTHTQTPRKYTIHKHTCTAQCTVHSKHRSHSKTIHTHTLCARFGRSSCGRPNVCVARIQLLSVVYGTLSTSEHRWSPENPAPVICNWNFWMCCLFHIERPHTGRNEKIN